MDYVWAQGFSHFFRERSFKSRQNPRADFFLRQEKTGKDSIRRFSIYCSWVLCYMDCLRLPCIREEEAVSWTQRFLTRKWYRKTTSYLEQPSRHFCQHLMRRTTQQTLLAINLASQQKTTKLYFSSRVRKQFKLLAVPFKPLRCCLRNDKLVNCHVWKFCKDLFLNLRVIWSVNQIVLFNGFLSDFVEITSCVYTKTIILFNLGE